MGRVWDEIRERMAEKRQYQKARRTPGTSAHTLDKILAADRALYKLGRQTRRRK